MKKPRSFALVAGAVGLAFVTLLMAAQVQSASPQSTKITGTTLLAAGDLKWTPMESVPGAQQAVLWGDPTKGPHGMLYKWPEGAKVPLHTHTYGDRGVILSGTMILTVDGMTAKTLPAGSYFSMAGGTKHVTEAHEDAPLLFFVEREGPMDVKLVEEKQ